MPSRDQAAACMREGQNPCRQGMFLQQVPEFHDCRVFGDRRAGRQARKLEHRSGLATRF